MQVKIELLNNFHTIRSSKIKERITRKLSIEEANALYNLLEKLLIKLEDKGREYWKERNKQIPEKMFSLILNEIKEESNNGFAEEDDQDLWGIEIL